MQRATLEAEFDERAFLASDLGGLLSIEAEGDSAKENHRAFLRFLANPGSSLRVIHHRSCPLEPVAFVLVMRGERQLYLSNIAVAASWRRCGVGRFALGKIAEFAREQGVGRIWLHVEEDNLDAQLFFQKMGYRAIEVIRGFYQSQDAYRMQRVLPRRVGRPLADPGRAVG